MQICELAKRTGVSAHALRHYEKLGLIQPARSNNGYRDYTEALRREVVFIAMSRQIGFSLKAIAAQLPAYRSGRLTAEQMVGAMRTRMADIDAQITSLRTQRRIMVSHIAWVKKQAAQAARPRIRVRVRARRQAQTSPALAQRQTRPARAVAGHAVVCDCGFCGRGSGGHTAGHGAQYRHDSAHTLTLSH